ncbi:geranylgeranylglycerol-phosphate geranylgeranyltransferase [Aequorivita echinoideorum]|uniref:Geranylgeranylglycerol-phosphate geranylgeranyltransferase n=1 Tax=Aequorivita echinoideorum TaxID=1549647 RepID=A0ABS5S6Q8_9FLAO|nr:geranylgeranylglycerol-phosphate geranylgeranyltransferase [Aequorivita echinoideorum]MBT0608897.1 geranylgeranylglycerol-phosphate geranylgeranyltransferase [Aequorivita echinoideorum]
MNYLKLIRYQNLLLIALVQIFIKYGLFNPFGAHTILNDFGFILLLVATLCIAAGGNIINDIYDVAIDRINKPEKLLIGKKISEKSAFRFYILLNMLGVGIGFYLSNAIGRPAFSAMFIIFSALLYLYASYLKGILLIDNILISALVAMSLLIVPVFDILPVINAGNRPLQIGIFKIVWHYTLFAFLINFIREIVKDIQDINGDKNGNLNTLPIAIGRKRTNGIVFILGVLAIFGSVFYTYNFLYNHTFLMLYFLFFVIAPLLYFCYAVWDAKTKKNYALLSNLLKIIMLLGMCSIPLFQFMLN